MSSLFWVFFKLGCTSFGGPIAHLGYFEREFVEKRKWLSAGEYAELIALCNFLPGPASSQVGMALGYRQQGLPGSLMAFAGFTLPSMLIMLVLASLMLSELPGWMLGVLHGLKLMAVVVVADAVLKMARPITGRLRQLLMLACALLMLLLDGIFVQMGVLVLAALVGYFFLQPSAVIPATGQNIPARTHTWLLAPLLAGLLLLPLLAYYFPALAWIDSFFRVGATVMGGGHVVLPMLNAETAVTGAMSGDLFLAGYSLAQAVPGPMFTLSSYLGVILGDGLCAGVLATLAIFLPGWMLLMLVLPVWHKMRSSTAMSGAVAGIHVGVVGLLVATLYRFVWAGAVTGSQDVAVVLVLWAVLVILKWPVWRAILIAAALGFIVSG